MTLSEPVAALPGIDAQPHARAVLGPALPPDGAPSHAYLFHGPGGTGKRTVARAFAAALLADGARNPGTVAQRVQRESHPDLIWVRPSGAAEMLVADIDEPVVAAATRTPFESARRVFVIEAVHTMNEQAANRMLKTLEEPPSFVHLILLADRPQDVLSTIASRCQLVRFDPLSSERIEERLKAQGIAAQCAAACARLALGDAGMAQWLADERGTALRAGTEDFIRAVFSDRLSERPWMGLLEAAREGGESARDQVRGGLAAELELLPQKERRRHEREGAEAERRAERRARTKTLDLALRLAELWLRDVWCILEGAGELVHAVDRWSELQAAAAAAERRKVLHGIELVQDTRLRLASNVSEELALEALAYRLRELLHR